jgi:hypothetical protein
VALPLSARRFVREVSILPQIPECPSLSASQVALWSRRVPQHSHSLLPRFFSYLDRQWLDSLLHPSKDILYGQDSQSYLIVQTLSQGWVHGFIQLFASPSWQPFLERQGAQDVVLYRGIEICWTAWFCCPPRYVKLSETITGQWGSSPTQTTLQPSACEFPASPRMCYQVHACCDNKLPNLAV